MAISITLGFFLGKISKQNKRTAESAVLLNIMVEMRGWQILNLLCLSTQAFGFGTGLRTTRLKTVPQTVLLTTRALSGFDSPISLDIKKQGSNKTSLFFWWR